jgi:hypothetical protein
LTAVVGPGRPRLACFSMRNQIAGIDKTSTRQQLASVARIGK